MSKFTKTLIASVLAVAVAGPAAAEVAENGVFKGTKMTIQIKPGSCKNTKVDVALSELEFESDSSYTESGYWYLEATDSIADYKDIEGAYIERKLGKDLTGSIYSPDLGECVPPVAPEVGLQCTGIVEVVRDYVQDAEGCNGSMNILQANDFSVTKGNVKLSKKGTRAKVDFKVEAQFTNAKEKDKKVTATIKSPNMDFVPFVEL